jgi:hypothetical protein
MKTHNYHSRLALLAIAFSLLACSKSETDGATAAAPATSNAAVPAATGLITSGLYKVCRVADDLTNHEDGLSRAHLEVGQTVKIEAIDKDDTTTLVCIGDACPSDPMNPGEGLEDKVLWMTGNEQLLETVQSFEHDTSSGGKKRALHLLKLTKAPSAPTGCSGNVLKLQFCKWGAGPSGPAWLCLPEVPHGGAAHIEN